MVRTRGPARRELKPHSDRNDGRPETELIKFYRQATNKIAGITDETADSVVALRGTTGEVVWHFQTVHHNLWDYDLASQPTLITVVKDGRVISAVAQATKTGFLFILNRDTGEPIFPVEERLVPRSNVPGEESWLTQPCS